MPFFSISASEFIEMIVGVGAWRVRDLFTQAKAAAPAIIFIDELDAIGRPARRRRQFGGGHDEREQTLNQILTEMDGFSSNSGVIVLAATNRPDVLDKALLRPGRFDRRIVVQPPDRQGRLEILRCTRARCRSRPMSTSARSPRRRPAWSAPTSRTSSTRPRCWLPAAATKGRDGRFHGRRREDRARRRAQRDDDRGRPLRTAYHEAGHALVAMLTDGADPVRKVSIIPRGMALGVTFSSRTPTATTTTRTI